MGGEIEGCGVNLVSCIQDCKQSLILKGRYTLDDKLQRHVAATYCSDKSLRVYWRIFVKIFVAATEFVATTSRADSVWFDFLRLVATTKFCCGDKDFHKNSPVHTKQFVAAMCRLTLLLQLVARPVHMEWSVAATCCCNLSPGLVCTDLNTRKSCKFCLPFCRNRIKQFSVSIIKDLYFEKRTTI